MSRWPGATWCDVTRDGRVVGVVGDAIHLHDGGLVTSLPEPLGWLRAEVSVAGALALVGQGQSGAGWLWAAGTWRLLGATFGVSPLEIVADGTGWLVYMQTAADRYDCVTLDAHGAEVARVAFAMLPTSQGFLDATAPRLTFTDRGRRVGGVMLPASAGPWLVGQDPTADRLLLADAHGVPVRVLAQAPVWEPRAVVVDGVIVACSRSDAGGAVVVRGLPASFPAWTPAVPAPEPPPTPEKPKEPEPVSYTSIAPNMLHVVEAVHRERPGLIHRPHDFTAAVAARLHALDPKWGLNGKRGNVADTSEDCVAYKAPASPAGGVEIYDIIAQANSPQAAPAWIDQTLVTVANGTIGAWVQPPSATTTLPEPSPPYQPPPATPTCKALSADEVRAAVRQEMALVLERVAHTDGVVTGLIDAVRSVQEQLAAAAVRREELADLTAQRIATTTAARPVTVSGRVSITGTTTLRGTVGEPTR